MNPENQNASIRRKPEFSNTERNGIFQYLLRKTTNGKLKNGAINEAATEFDCHRITISRIWKRGCKSYGEGNLCANVDSRKKQKCGRKRKNYADNLARIREVPFNRRSTLRSLAFAIGIPKSTLFNIFQRGEFKRASSTVKPYLTEENKKDRLQFCLSKINSNGFFEDMYDTVHIDEKWFYLTKVKNTYYLCLDEEVPHRTCKSKRFITKVRVQQCFLLIPFCTKLLLR